MGFFFESDIDFDHNLILHIIIEIRRNLSKIMGELGCEVKKDLLFNSVTTIFNLCCASG